MLAYCSYFTYNRHYPDYEKPRFRFVWDNVSMTLVIVNWLLFGYWCLVIVN